MGVLAAGFEAFHSAATATDRADQTSAIAQEKVVESKQKQAEYQTGLQRKALGERTLIENPTINLATEEGKAQYFDEMRKRSHDPETQFWIDGLAKKQDMDLTAAKENKAKQLESDQTITYDKLQNALNSVDDPTAWEGVIASAKTPQERQQLEQISKLHQSEAYKKASPDEKDMFNESLIAKYAPMKAKVKLEAMLQKRAYDQARLASQEELKKAQLHYQEQVIAARLAGNKEKASNDSLMITRSDLADQRYAAKRIELTDKLLAAGEPTEDAPYWFTGDQENKTYSTIKKQLDDLDVRYKKTRDYYDRKLGITSTGEPTPETKASEERPSGIPPNAQYSPSTNEFWWQENGQWKSAKGK
jgi:hypothetical protein